MKKIVLDVYGADHSPEEIIKGAVDAVNSDNEICVVLCGKKDEMEGVLHNYKYSRSQIEIADASEVITNMDVPTDAIRTKKNSSLVRATEILNTDSDAIGMVSAGSTGAVLTASIFKVGRIKGIQRPALAPLMPTVKGGNVLVVDCGANVDSKPQFLVGFALMGSAYMKSLFNIERPRVALLSNGAEDKKGNELTQEAFKLLKNTAEINFVGNMEAREALSGDYDVIVTDGFAGNVLIKSIEGAAKMILSALKQEITSSGSAKFGYLFMRKSFKRLQNRLDYNKMGGAPFLGVEKLVIKSHGSSKAKDITASILQAKTLHANDLVGKIKSSIEGVDIRIERNV